MGIEETLGEPILPPRNTLAGIIQRFRNDRYDSHLKEVAADVVSVAAELFDNRAAYPYPFACYIKGLAQDIAKKIPVTGAPTALDVQPLVIVLFAMQPHLKAH